MQARSLCSYIFVMCLVSQYWFNGTQMLGAMYDKFVDSVHSLMERKCCGLHFHRLAVFDNAKAMPTSSQMDQ